jgi:ankyrin repeat protein
MNQKLMEYLCGFEDKYPHVLEAKFARIVEEIARLWDGPNISGYFAELLIDDRGDRKGFEPDIAREIFLLSIAHDEIRNKRREETDVWAAERTAARKEIEQLNLKFMPAHMLKAAESNNPAPVMLFLKAGMAVDTRDERDWTPLMVAAFNGNEAVARALIQHGANVQARDRGGYMPLHWAALNGYESVVRLLIGKGVDRNARSNSGWTPLMQAATRGHATIVSALLDAGANPNIASEDGWTAMHKAVANQHSETVAILLNAGASILARHTDGSTPLSIAQKGNFQGIVEALRGGIKLTWAKVA